jgi:hypothetical protein
VSLPKKAIPFGLNCPDKAVKFAGRVVEPAAPGGPAGPSAPVGPEGPATPGGPAGPGAPAAPVRHRFSCHRFSRPF